MFDLHVSSDIYILMHIIRSKNLQDEPSADILLSLKTVRRLLILINMFIFGR